jgi:hypothetical protein
MQVPQRFSPFGLSRYFVAARMAAFVEAITLPDRSATGIMAIAAPPIFRNCRREGFVSSFITDFLCACNQLLYDTSKCAGSDNRCAYGKAADTQVKHVDQYIPKCRQTDPLINIIFTKWKKLYSYGGWTGHMSMRQGFVAPRSLRA